jgi:RHH-type proline utilization regulon transcriptional repressor/proline dehydrogenase/delta 1-pyrroline-5-carboxylate dehydrogenase
VRDKPAPFWALESLLREYPISSAEGLALMREAEALLRVPDAETAIALTADQLGRADFSGDGDADAPHRLLASLSSSAIVLAKRWLPGAGEPPGLLERLGSRTVVAATVRAIQLLGRHLETKTSLTCPTRAGDRQQPGVWRLQHDLDGGQLIAPSQELRGL